MKQRQSTINRMLILVVFVFGIMGSSPNLFAQEFDTKEALEKMDKVLRGNSHQMKVALDVKTKRWQRHYEIEVLMKGVDYAYARVLSPSKVEGQGFLRIETRLWQYLPTAERTILIPPSLMLDDFMGSDFSNDDFVKMSYMARDYDAKLIQEAEVEGHAVFQLELSPLPDAPVTYGMLNVWLRQSDSAPVKIEFYNEKKVHIRTLHYTEFKTYGNKEVPSVWHMKDHKKKENETIVTILEAAYDLPLEDSRFTRKNLEKYP